MSNGLALLAIFTLAVFVGFEVVSKVSTTLHTPLMSGANAIHGIILVGAIIVAGHADGGLQLILGVLAVVLATINMIGGFVVIFSYENICSHIRRVISNLNAINIFYYLIFLTFSHLAPSLLATLQMFLSIVGNNKM